MIKKTYKLLAEVCVLIKICRGKKAANQAIMNEFFLSNFNSYKFFINKQLKAPNKDCNIKIIKTENLVYPINETIIARNSGYNTGI